MGRGSSGAVASKLRRAMSAPERNPLSGLVELDETSIRQRAGQGAKGSRGRSHDGKLLIAGAVEAVAAGEEIAPGRIRPSVIDDFSARSLHGFVVAGIGTGSLVKTDGWSVYNGVEDDWLPLPHVVGAEPAHRVLPWGHRVFSLFKTWVPGVYHGLRPEHLQSYLDEFVFRFNRRRTHHAAFGSLLAIATGKPLITYKMLISPEATA